MRLVKAAGMALLGIYGVIGAFRPEWFHLLNGVNLLFHEAGHVFLSPFGEYLQIWGGTLFQVLFPLAIAAAFWVKGQPCSAACVTWWSGQNFFGISSYIKDARVQAMPFVGGEIHDWEYILGRHQLLQWDQQIGNSVWLFGLLIIAAASIYGMCFSLNQNSRLL